MDEFERVATSCKELLPLGTAELSKEYGYRSLPLCVIDAVWSIGVKYTGVRNVVARYRSHFKLVDKASEERHTIEDLVVAMRDHGSAWFAKEVFQNAQRTSPTNGIPKSEAVLRFASVLLEHGMNTVLDVPNIDWYEELFEERKKPYAQDLLSITGQKSGISLAYFFMLTGSTGLTKPDTMVSRFLKETLGREVTFDDAQRLVSYASRRLNADFPALTPLGLDHEIWKYESAKAARGRSKSRSEVSRLGPEPRTPPGVKSCGL